MTKLSEIMTMRFGISLRDEEIEGMAQGEWKSLVKRQLKVTALNELLQKRQKKGSSIEYGKLMTRNYFDKLPTQDAKLYFKLRAEVYDLRLSGNISTMILCADSALKRQKTWSTSSTIAQKYLVQVRKSTCAQKTSRTSRQ